MPDGDHFLAPLAGPTTSSMKNRRPCYHTAARPCWPAPCRQSPGAHWGFSASPTSAWRLGCGVLSRMTFPPASTWHLTVLTPFPQSGAVPSQLWRENRPCWSWLAHCGWRMLGADTPIALTGKTDRLGGVHCRGAGRGGVQGPLSSLCLVGRPALDIDLFLHMFPLVSLFIAQ